MVQHRSSFERRDRVIVAWLSPANVSRYFHKSMLEMVLHDAIHDRHIVGIMDEESGATVANTRNVLTKRFLEDSVADWLLFVDADMIFERGALDRLLSQADPKERPVIGALYFGGNQNGCFPQLYFINPDAEDGPMTARADEVPEGDGPIHVAGTGAGFLLIHRTVLEDIRARDFSAAYPWWAETEMSGKPVGEDLTFCLRAAMCGHRTFVDLGLPIGHHKTTVIGLKTHVAQVALSREEALAGGHDR